MVTVVAREVLWGNMEEEKERKESVCEAVGGYFF
jgi:hypothetical protein